MYKRLIELKDSLEENWTYLHKILFTFSFYLLYKVFLKVLTPEQMSPFVLIFIVLGFFIFSMDILIYPLIDLFSGKNLNSLDKKTKTADFLVYFTITVAVITTVLYYITDYYPYVIATIFSLFMAVLLYAYFMNYYTSAKTGIIKFSVIALSITGFAGVLHSFYLNKDLNVNTFTLIFVLGFFITDYLIYKWRVN